MSHTLTKDELRRPDHIKAAGIKVMSKIMKNQRLVLGVGAVLLLIGVVFAVWEKVAVNKELSVQEQYYSIEKSYLKKKESFSKAEADKSNPPVKDDKKAVDAKADAEKSTPSSGDLTKDYGSEVTEFNKLIESNAGSKAAAMAALELSNLYVSYKQPSEALQVLAKVKNQQNSDTLIGALVFHAYANLLAGQNQCAEAMPIWENLEKKKNLSFFAEQATLGRAYCLESVGQIEKAEVLLKGLVAGDSSMEKQAPQKTKTQTQKAAEKYLRYLQVKKNMGAPKNS